MASNYTENYGLCQWEPGDNFVRTEFNQDNAKIDAALGVLAAEKLGTVETIQTVRVATSQREILMDMTGFDWSEWRVVIVKFQGTFQNAGQDDASSFIMRGSTSFTCCIQEPPGPIMAVFFPGQDGSQSIWGLGFPGGTLIVNGGSYQGIETIKTGVSSPVNFAPGGSVTLYGIR